MKIDKKKWLLNHRRGKIRKFQFINVYHKRNLIKITLYTRINKKIVFVNDLCVDEKTYQNTVWIFKTK